MPNYQDNVILFPKWRNKLEEESLQALKEKRYEEALIKLDELLSYRVNNYEILLGKLMCLMELDRYEEAQDLCELLIKHKRDENYYHYVHIYLTILFQTSQYHLLMEQVEFEFASGVVPDVIYEQFQQLYDMSKEMQNEITYEKSSEYISQLLEAADQQNHAEQWRLVERMRQIDADPTQAVKSLLTNEKVHPVTKTAILKWLKMKSVSDEVTISKLDTKISIRPANTPDIESHPTMKQLILVIGELEQENPTLFQIVNELLYRYIYVRYPVMPDDCEITNIAKALIQLGEAHLDEQTIDNENIEGRVTRFMDEIKMCEVLYSAVIEA